MPPMPVDLPHRLRRRRLRGWRAPPGAIYVGRPTRYANPHTVAALRAADPTLTLEAAHTQSVALYHADILAGRLPVTVVDIRRHLAGRDLLCWCHEALPCHADVLLKIANSASLEEGSDV